MTTTSIMTRFVAVCLLVAVPASGVAAFSVSRPVSTTRALYQQQQHQSIAFESSTTAMHMAAPRIKIDPNKQDDDDDRLNPAVFKNALYLGSIAFAILLPIFFLVASQK
jgi:hypothetical protein